MGKIIVTTEEELTQLIENAVSNAVARIQNTVPPQENLNEYLTATEAVAFLKLKNVTSIHQACHKGILPSSKRFGRLYFKKSDLIKWMEEARRPGKREPVHVPGNGKYYR